MNKKKSRLKGDSVNLPYHSLYFCLFKCVCPTAKQPAVFCWVMYEAERTLSNFYIQLSLKYLEMEREVAHLSPTQE